jgi:hypothetical protein
LKLPVVTDPAPPDRRYHGQHEGDTGPGIVRYLDPGGRFAKLNPRLDLRNHSPTGFAWGYGGSGPAQLALALVADATGDDALAQRVYQEFKFRIVAGWHSTWNMTAEDIQAVAERIEADRKVEP